MVPSGLELVGSGDPLPQILGCGGCGCGLMANRLADGAVLIQVVVTSLRRPGYLGKRLSLPYLYSFFPKIFFPKTGQSVQILFMF